MTVENAEKTSRANRAGRRDKTMRCLRSGRLAVLAAAVAIGLAACSGGSGWPHVANLGSSTSVGASNGSSRESASSSTALPGSNPTQLLDKWAACMRAHGDPAQADPTIDANKMIHVAWNDAILGGIYGTNKGGQGNAGPGQYCRTYIDEAETDLQGAQHQQQPSQVQLLRLSQCMRANGVPDFPDPRNGGLAFNVAGGGDLNPSNPVFEHASTLCAKKVGVPGFGSPSPGSVEFNGGSTGVAGG